MRILLLAIFATGLVAADASAATVSCRVGYYAPDLEERVSELRATNLPRLTSDYAPRCLVAESVAGLVELKHEDTGAVPRSIKVHGARWNSGKWTCSSRTTDGVLAVTCRKVGATSRRVTFRVTAS